MKFSSQEYNKGEITETSGLLLVSNWTDDFVTEFSYTTKDQITSQQSPLEARFTVIPNKQLWLSRN